MPTKLPGGWEQNGLGRLPPVATERHFRSFTSPPLPTRGEEAPQSAELPLSPLSLTLSPVSLLSRSLSLSATNPSLTASVLELRRDISVVPSFPRPIAATRSCASTSSPSSPSRASRDAVVESPSTIYRKYTGRASSSIPATADLPVPRRPSG